MSDFGFFDQPLQKGNKAQNIGKQRNPLLFKDVDKADVVVLVDNWFDITRYENLHIIPFIRSTLGKGTTLKVVSVIPYEEKPERIDSSPTEYYRRHGVDLTKYVAAGSKVLASGRATLALTRGDLSVGAFYDFVMNKSHFYAPHLKSEVFPVPNTNFWRNEGWDRFFTAKQLELLKAFSYNATREPKVEKVYISDPSEFFAQYANEPTVAIDTETSSLDYFSAEVGCVTMSFDGKWGAFLPWAKVNPAELGDFIRDKYQVYMNGQYDTKILRNNGVDPDALHIDYDIWHGGHVLNEMSPNSLKSQAWVYTRHGGYDWPLEDYKRRYRRLKNYLDIPNEELLPYAVMDAVVTYQIYARQVDHLRWVDENFPPQRDQHAFSVPLNYTLSDYFYGLVMPAVRAFNDIEWEGIHINIDELRRVEKNLTEDIKKAREDVRQAFSIPKSVSLDSAEQLGNHIASVKNGDGSQKYPLTKRDKLGRSYLLNDDVVRAMHEKGFDEFQKIQHYRQLSTYLNTFIGVEAKGAVKGNGFWQHLRRHPDGSYRVHSSMAVFLKKSGRNGSKAPNLQNIPKRNSDYAHEIRGIFCPPSEDYYIMEADGAGYQLRIGAALSGDPEMKRAFADPKIKGDLHSVTTQAVFLPHMSVDEILEKKAAGDKQIEAIRFKGKQTNLSLEFGATGFTFGESLRKEWSIQEARDYVNENNLQEKVDHLYKKALKDPPGRYSKSDITRDLCRFWATALHLREKYFAKYPVLGRWIDTFSKFPTKRGYTRSVHGAFRRLPQLMFYSDGGGEGKHFANIAVNSPVQNFENAVMSGKVIVGLHNFIKEQGLKSQVGTMVHDSVVMYIHKDEVETIVAKARELFEAPVPENNGVPMVLEAQVADYWGKGEVWGEGAEY